MAYIEPMAVGSPLPVMPVFLTNTHYVNLPLDATYQAAFTAVPKHHRERLSRD